MIKKGKLTNTPIYRYSVLPVYIYNINPKVCTNSTIGKRTQTDTRILFKSIWIQFKLIIGFRIISSVGEVEDVVVTALICVW